MGCDIHTMVEIRRQRYENRQAGDDGGWRWLQLDADELSIPNPYYDPDSDQAYWRDQPKHTSEPFGGRNYDLFALLADVRNGYGFAGVKRGDPIEPLDQPRGVPDDASHAWLAEVESWDVDMHSHTYFTLAELLEFQAAGRFGIPMRRTGVIDSITYEKIKASGFTLKPESWIGSISGGGIVTLTPEQYDAGERAPEFTETQLAEFRQNWYEGKLKRGEEWTDADDARFKDWHSVARRTNIQYVWEDDMTGSTVELVAAIDAAKRYADDLAPADSTYEKKDEPGYHGHGGIQYDHIRFVMGFDN